ncbi:beta-galactosidase [Polaribacter sp. Z014]|uniref:glycoside hydrolase family 2 protein n=1 Tax=Polaribacter sp. Z014 TaxID=2927126 RepID=UPI002021ABA6|nr:glycoside hydrolase family 2 TIM barrel-domain containing protein [Polaribacter sp. Z014]MCL7762530.1 beta-galactosidase [Polaribacter sp. Z014]
MKNKFIFTTILFLLLVFSENVKAQVNSEKNQTEIHYLSGTGKDDTVAWDFYCSDGMNSKKWTKIGVPSCWELQGFGNYNYGRDFKIPKKYNDEYGLYKHTFSVPKNWKQKEVKIVFEGVMTDCEVKINGKLAGEIHQGAFYEFKYGISKLLKYGTENLLEVKVNKMSANESVNYAERHSDFWIFGGIYRPVYLEVLPKEHINNVAIDAQANGNITAELFFNPKEAKTVQMNLLDLNGDIVQELSGFTTEKKEGKWILKGKAANVKTWNAEKPNLYALKMNLLDKKGKTIHTISKRIGFRTVEIRESDGIYVNGQKIKFKGVNRHSFYPNSGRTTSKELSIEHIKMMKDMNMNAVRMSHYPPDVHFLEACDSLGLFVIDELCTWHNPYLDTKVGKKLVKEMIVRDVNHSSILIWANGNESGWNLELDKEFSKWDVQNREVIHPWNSFKKMNTMHYPDYYKFAFDSPVKDKIYFPTEFLHGLYDGGHGAGLDDYWKQMWNMPLAAGGFLWDFADEGVVRTDKGGIIDLDNNHAADGIVGPYGEKEGSYFTIKEIWSPIFIEDRYIRDDFSGVFNVENRYHFTNLNECSMTAKWVRFNGPGGTTDFNIVSESKVELPELSPVAKGKFKVDKPKNWKSADALFLTASDIHGMEIFTWTYPVKTPKKINADKLNFNVKGSIKTIKTDTFITVSAGENEFKFSAENGLLKEVKKNGKLIPIKDGPILLGNKSALEKVKVNASDDKVEITGLFKERKKYYDWKENDEMTLDFFKWTIYPNGLLDLKVELRSQKIVEGYMGITFSFPEEEVKGMKWLGDGPYRVWRNRMKGTQFRVWENDYNNTVTGESGFVYPEFKGFFSSLNWVKLKGKQDNGFTVYCHSDLTFLRMLTPDQPADPKKGAIVTNFPKGDISFVKNIPAMGTKFMPASASGPQGSPKNYFGNVDEPIKIDLTFEF